jgi:HPt (histidine-containing phosphotransfer) domain-containing protein
LLRGNQALFEKLIRQFQVQFTPLARQLQEDLQAGRPLDAARRLHSLRGITGYIGALDLSEAARQLELALRGNNPETGRLLEAFLRQLDDVLAALPKAA